MPKQIIWKSTIPAPELPESSLIQYLIGGAGQTPLPQFATRSLPSSTASRARHSRADS